MSVSSKTVYRVRQLVGHDVAIISEVKDGDANSGKVKETRDSRMALWGTDSFWLVTGEKKEPKILLQKEDAISPAFSIGVSPMAARIQASSIFKVPKLVNENVVPGKFDAVSFSSATKLIVGYSPPDGSNDETLTALSQGTLHIPLETAVSAIEVRPGQWLTSGFDALPSGRYGLKRATLRSVATVALENSPEMIRLGHGLVVFASNPKWSEPKCTDLRSEEEIFQSVERWLSRTTAALTLPAGPMAPTELLRLLADKAVSEEEKADLAAVAGHLSMRTELADILPKILGRDAAFKDMIARFGEAEKIRLRAELEDQLRRETEADSARLAALREEVATAEAKLAMFSHREALLRTETEKHEETLRDRIASAAEGIKSESSRDAAMIREEVARLRDDMAQIAAAAPAAPMPVAAPQAEEAAPTPPRPPFASDEQRQKTVRELSVATGLTHPEVAAVIALGMDVVPVLVGPDAAAAVVDIATAIAGEDAAIVFCDPTRLSLADILNDENSGFKAAIDMARARPEMLAAAALCGITNGPCEYWLPQIIEMRRVGRLPRNLTLFASAGTDGMRISIPDTALRHLFPVAAGKLARPGSAKFEGLWPSAGSDPERFQEAVDILIDGGLEGVVMQNAARALARTPAWMKVGDLKDVFLRQAKWLSATAAGDEHEHNKYFKNIEG
ncbi:hypothetical protein HGO38_19530 [Rhizobium sp. CG5]|uniref:apolipoprotein A1/A4/E family protein n=1 Tax=Rhizobium sp. CG5 TaxID=2726076 RepID=UPI0020347FC6|nr:apolipoprotein A1/A4/E family protein [Rhizobium sp. CG5]MCM2475670.1 hypothetical protein [Rhizobium sp. CG5]